jgi:hypothetical protein
MRGLSTSSSDKISLPLKDFSPSSELFQVSINRVNVGTKGLKGGNGSVRVITLRIRVQPSDKVVVVLPFSYSWAAIVFVGVEVFFATLSF